MTDNIEVYKRRYEREKNARIEAETLLESKSRELYFSNEVLKELTADLEKIVQLRTTELKIAHDQAIASNNAKSLFLANMSHEIRTPMNGILGILHLLSQSQLDQKQQRLLKTAKNSSELLLTIINDILDVSKIDAGKFTLEPIDIDIVEVIESTLDMFEVSANSKDLRLKKIIASNLPAVIKGDPTRIRQILSNLLSNAIKFTDAGCITLTAESDGKNGIKISILDQGIGIKPEQLKNIFAPFTQADESITRHYGGTGLGLAICAHLTELMGEKITVTSEYGKGSCFSFVLQLPIVMQSREAQKSSITHKQSNKKFNGQSILLVDDNVINRDIGSEILIQQGLSVSTCCNGKEAVQAIQQKSIDAVLMDVQMPIMDGLTATQIIRNLGGRYKELPIVAMTAHAQQEDIDKSLAAGMNAHLTKPIQPEQLFNTLSQWLTFSLSEPTMPALPNTINEVENELPSIDGVNFKDSLARVNNNLLLLRKILISFYKLHANDGSKLQTFYSQNNTLELQQLAHTLKGSGATIGAIAVSEKASEVEAACKKGLVHEAGDKVTELIDLMGTLIMGLSSINEEPVAAIKAGTNILSGDELIKKIEAFSEFLTSDLVQAENILESLSQATSSQYAEYVSSIKKHFDAFDFESIYPLLVRWQQNIKSAA